MGACCGTNKNTQNNSISISEYTEKKNSMKNCTFLFFFILYIFFY